jgi:putative sterol carrier protein
MAIDGTVESCEEKIDEASANGVVEIDSDIFVGIYNKTVSQAEARASGKIKARGSLDAMLKVWVPTIE